MNSVSRFTVARDPDEQYPTGAVADGQERENRVFGIKENPKNQGGQIK